MSCVHSIILAYQQALEGILNSTNHKGKSAKDVAMYNKACRDILVEFGAKNVSPPPEDWSPPLAEGHKWKRRK